MSQYVLSYGTRYHRPFAYAHLCNIDIKQNKVINVKEFSINSDLKEAQSKFTNYNIAFSVPVCHSDYAPIPLFALYLKREISEPEIIALYSNPGSEYKSDDEIEYEIYKYCNNDIDLSIDKNRIKSINLNVILRTVLKDCYDMSDLKITHRHNNLGFSVRFTLNYMAEGDYSHINESNLHNFKEGIVLRVFNIFDVKESMLKFIDQLQSIVHYDQINREIILKLLKDMGHLPVTYRIGLNITDIINSNKFATLDDDFVNYFNNIEWDEKFNNFQSLIKDTNIINNISDSKSINLRGAQFIVKNRVTCTFPAIINENINNVNILQLGYAILTYFDKYDDLLNAISLVKLRSLSSS